MSVDRRARTWRSPDVHRYSRIAPNPCPSSGLHGLIVKQLVPEARSVGLQIWLGRTEILCHTHEPDGYNEFEVALHRWDQASASSNQDGTFGGR